MELILRKSDLPDPQDTGHPEQNTLAEAGHNIAQPNPQDDFYNIGDWSGEEHSWIESHLDALNPPSHEDLESLINAFQASFSRSLRHEDIHNKWVSLILIVSLDIPGLNKEPDKSLPALPTHKPLPSPKQRRTSARVTSMAKRAAALSADTTMAKVSKKTATKAIRAPRKSGYQKKSVTTTPNCRKVSHGPWTAVVVPGDTDLEASYLKNGFPAPGDPIYLTPPAERFHPLHPKYSYITKTLREGGYSWKEICWLFGRQEDIPRWPEEFPRKFGKYMLTIGTRALDMRKSRA